MSFLELRCRIVLENTYEMFFIQYKPGSTSSSVSERQLFTSKLIQILELRKF